MGIEIGRLTALGMLDRRSHGPREVRLGLRSEHPLWQALRALARAAAPVEDVLRAALADVAGIEDAWVFGSTATGDDRPDSDVDVLIVGAPDERQLARRLIDAEMLLGREVQASTMTPAEWAEASASTRPFFRSLVAGPKRWLIQAGVPVRPVGAVTAATSSPAPRPRTRRPA